MGNSAEAERMIPESRVRAIVADAVACGQAHPETPAAVLEASVIESLRAEDEAHKFFIRYGLDGGAQKQLLAYARQHRELAAVLAAPSA